MIWNSRPWKTRDWRIDNAKRTRGSDFRLKPYKRRSESWEHEHCIACWAKFMEKNSLPDVHTEGYLNDNDQWVCAGCFKDLRDSMGWKLLS